MQAPKIGDKGRHHVGSDCYPITVTRVSKSGKVVWYRQEDFKAGEGHDYFGTQVWVVVPRENAAEHRCDWSEKRNRYQVNGYGSIFFDGWHVRQDPSF